ncbi:MAG: hypothetical protein IJX52_00880 [Oscillibacter sp.]|nr:hypothetical protein [Oscillibacter sp.]
MILLSFAAFLSAVLFCVITGQNLLWALWLGIVLFSVIALRRGHTIKNICAMAWTKGKTALIVIPVLLIIGTVTGLWRSSGTIACFLYYGLKSITPNWFVLMAFLLSALLSFMLGTAFGVASTAGVVLITIARTGGVDLAVTAGAVLSGAFFGDRCSPMSSCAALVAACTESELYPNIKEMLRTAALPTVLTALFYTLLSRFHPITTVDPEVLSALSEGFDLQPLVLLPAALMLALPLVKVPIKTAMAVSAALALVLSVTLPGQSLTDSLYCAVMGYQPAGELASILSGGGIISMLKACCIVMSTSLLAGILEGIEAFSGLNAVLEKLAGRIGLFPTYILVSLLTAMCFCNQSVVIVMGAQLMGPHYKRLGASPRTHAMDLANSGVVLAGMIPWSIAVAIPLAMMEVGSTAILYAALLYLLPLCYLLTRRFFLPGQQER